jgi:hypothetical protein
MSYINSHNHHINFYVYAGPAIVGTVKIAGLQSNPEAAALASAQAAYGPHVRVDRNLVLPTVEYQEPLIERVRSKFAPIVQRANERIAQSKSSLGSRLVSLGNRISGQPQS